MKEGKANDRVQYDESRCDHSRWEERLSLSKYCCSSV